MRSFGVALIIAFVAALLTPTAASAAKPAESPITKEQRQKGMDAAPGLITAAGLDCKLTDARLIGQSTDPKTKVASSFYELACDGNEGLIIQSSVGAAPAVFTCVEASAPGPDGKKGNVACILPGNVDPNAGLKPYVAKAGTACDLDKVRAIGHNTTITAFELACQGGQGFLLQISTPPRLDKPVTMVPCLALPPDGNIQCTLSDRASQLAMVDRLVTQSGKPCAIKDRRYVGTSPSTGEIYYEVACQDGKGYVIQTAADGAYKAMIDCAAAEGIGGGCTLTNYREIGVAAGRSLQPAGPQGGVQLRCLEVRPAPGRRSGQGGRRARLLQSSRRRHRRVRHRRRGRLDHLRLRPFRTGRLPLRLQPGLDRLSQPDRRAQEAGQDDLRGLQLPGSWGHRRQAQRRYRGGVRRRSAGLRHRILALPAGRHVGAALQPGGEHQRRLHPAGQQAGLTGAPRADPPPRRKVRRPGTASRPPASAGPSAGRRWARFESPPNRPRGRPWRG